MDPRVNTHPNRSTWRSDLTEPSCDALVQARHAAQLSREAAAEIAGVSSAARWQDYESGTRRIHWAVWELFLLRTGQHPSYILTPREEP